MKGRGVNNEFENKSGGEDEEKFHYSFCIEQ